MRAIATARSAASLVVIAPRRLTPAVEAEVRRTLREEGRRILDERLKGG
jgi:hypothetical protein